METSRRLSGRLHLRVAAGPRSPRLLLVDGDLGRRATLAVALGTRYAVDTAAGAREAHTSATLAPFDLAVLDAAVLRASLPRLVRILRARSRAVQLVIIAGRRDLRGLHYAATLGIDARLGRLVPAYALLDRIDALVGTAARGARFDRGVGRAIDLMARDVTHLLDVNALADATGVPLPLLAERFFSSRPRLWTTQFHYSAPIAVILVLGLVDVLGRVRPRASRLPVAVPRVYASVDHGSRPLPPGAPPGQARRRRVR